MYNPPNMAPKKTRKYKPAVCNDKMTFQECELAVLRHVVDESETRQGAKIANSPEVVQIIKILEDFLVRKRLICYGGTAINNILPKEAQFYDREIEVPDYDFFSKNALNDAKELADAYFVAGYDEVEAKAGMHPGTYKVYVSFLPVADITYLHPILFDSLSKEAITVAGIKYAPPNYLRMAMFLELSRPNGDVSRWEKVLKRINLLNRYHPLNPGDKCNTIEFQRELDIPENKGSSESIYDLAKDSFVDQGAVFLGGYGTSLYSKYMDKDKRHQVSKIPDFDVLAEDPAKCAAIVKDKLTDAGFKGVKLVQHTSIGEVIPSHVEINVRGDMIALIYKPIACHSYNKIDIGGKEVRVATIDTMLSFYLAFLYADKAYFDKDRMLCMSAYLFEVEQKNSLEQKGLLKRFSLDCYGKQPTMEEIRATKARKYEELKTSKDQKEKEMWFLKYRPVEKKPWLSKRRQKETNAEQHESPAKTMVIRSLSSGLSRGEKERGFQRPKPFRQTRKRNINPRWVKNPYEEEPIEEESHPYAKKQFAFFNKRR